jgi:hypothetical protein
MKDPAFLFYFNEVSHDIFYMSRLERGCYLDLIIAQKKFGPLTEDQIKKILADDYEKCWPSLKICFTYDKDMKTYYLEWLDESIKKRKAFSESRRKNRTKNNNQPQQQQENSSLDNHINNISLSYDNHMGNGNGIVVVVEDLNLKKEEKFFSENSSSPACRQASLAYREASLDCRQAIPDSHNASTNNILQQSPSTIFAIWSKPNPSLGEIQILEKLISEYSFEEVKKAFYISEEQGIRKLSYVKGILKKQKDAKLKAEKNQKIQNTYKPLPPEEKQNWKNFSKEFLKSLHTKPEKSSY